MAIGKKLRYNKVCEIEDFENPEIRFWLRHLFGPAVRSNPNFPKGEEQRKAWEFAMMMRGLADMGILNQPGIRALGVGAGTEPTSYWLTMDCDEVIATDMYLSPGVWVDYAHAEMLTNPAKYAPEGVWLPSRLKAQHMDGRKLEFEDNSFDIVYSAGSIEHFGTLDDICQSAKEIGRVLKPGGYAAITTEFIYGAEDRKVDPKLVSVSGWDGTYLFSELALMKHFIAPSGLVPVDKLDTSVSDRTWDCAQDWPQPAIYYPHICFRYWGVTFGSVNLLLTKKS